MTPRILDVRKSVERAQYLIICMVSVMTYDLVECKANSKSKC